MEEKDSARADPVIAAANLKAPPYRSQTAQQQSNLQPQRGGFAFRLARSFQPVTSLC